MPDMNPSLLNGPPLSVGYFSPGWPLDAFPNGIVTYTTVLDSRLREQGHKVSILARHVAEGAQNQRIYDFEQARTSLSPWERLIAGLWYRVEPRSATEHLDRRAFATSLRRLIAEQGIDILEIEESFGWACWAKQAAPIPVCVRLHGPWFINGPILGVPEDGAFHKRVSDEGQAIRAADAVTSPSRNVLDQVRERYGLALPDAEVIPNPTQPVAAADRWRFEDCDPRRILFIGRFDRHKGGDLIIDAFGRVLHEAPEARLCFVGPDRGCVADDGRTWNLEDYVRGRLPGALESGTVEWLGQQPFSALAPLRRGALLSVICSRYENFPNSVIEPLALGCPIVAARAGGIPEIIEDGVNGLLHRSGDPADLADRIVSLLKNPARAADLGQRAGADCERRFYPDVVLARTLDLYRATIQRARKSK